MRQVGLTGVLVLMLACIGSANGQEAAATTPFTGVFTYHNNNARTGLNASETILTPVNVNSASFGKLATYVIDGYVHAQPLYVPNVSIPNQGTHNVVYVATENDSVYAFDADGSLAAPLWQKSFINAAAGITPVPCGDIDVASHCDFHSASAPVGILPTAVIDIASQTMYVEARTKENGSYFHRLHALDIATGAEKFGGPIVIAASIPGSGEGGNGTTLTFDPLRQNSRPGLLYLNGVVYIGFAGRGDIHPYHGWLFGYSPDPTTQVLSLISVFNTTPNAGSLSCTGSQGAGGIWSPGALSSDSNGFLYASVGQGYFDATVNDYGDSYLKFSIGTAGLQLMDYFTPFNQMNLNCFDWDAGSGSPLILPNQSNTTHPHLLVVGTKEGEAQSKYNPKGRIYLIDRDNMGAFNAAGDKIVQELSGTSGLIFNSFAFWNGRLYVGGQGRQLQIFKLKNGLFSTAPVSQTSTSFFNSGTNPTVSSNGSTNGIVWTPVQVGSTGNQFELRAYDATNLGILLYSTAQVPARDAIGGFTHHASATIANGKVYFASSDLTDLQGKFFIFGPLP